MVCAASGPSLTPADLEYCRSRGWPIWATNDSYKLGCDGLYASDRQWWEANPHASGERWTQDKDASERYGLNWIRSLSKPGFSEYPRWIHQGRTSGYQLLNLVCLWGASRVILLGYDMRWKGKAHWFGSHKGMLVNPSQAFLAEAAREFDTIQPLKAEVLNCTEGSAITRFPFAKLRDIE